MRGKQSRSKFTEFLDSLMSLDRERQIPWFWSYLHGAPCEPEAPPANLEKDEFIIRIYDESRRRQFGQDLKEVILPRLLESCEEIRGDEEYFFNLLSLITYFRPTAAKDRLRRLLYSGVVERQNLSFGPFDLECQLIVANCQYDVDARLKNFIRHTLANKDDFKKYALASYRGLMYAYDETPFLLIPKTARYWSDNEFFSKFTYYLRVSIEKSGSDTFARTYPVILGRIREIDPQLGEKFNRLLAEEIFVADPKRFDDAHYFEMYLGLKIECKEMITPEEIKLLLSDAVDLRRETKVDLLARYYRMRKETVSVYLAGLFVKLPLRTMTTNTDPRLILETGPPIVLRQNETSIVHEALVRGDEQLSQG